MRKGIPAPQRQRESTREARVRFHGMNFENVNYRMLGFRGKEGNRIGRGGVFPVGDPREQLTEIAFGLCVSHV